MALQRFFVAEISERHDRVRNAELNFEFQNFTRLARRCDYQT